jgi:hypothetical protein
MTIFKRFVAFTFSDKKCTLTHKITQFRVYLNYGAVTLSKTTLSKMTTSKLEYHG